MSAIPTSLEFETESQIRLRLIAEDMKIKGREWSSKCLNEAREEIEALRERIAELEHEVNRTRRSTLPV
jgi:predicted transcriptional regulator